MNNEEQKYEFMHSAYNSFISECTAVYNINLKMNTYEEVKADDGFRSLISDSGELPELYKKIYLMNRLNHDELEQNYEVFIDTNIFKNKYFVGQVELVINNEYRYYTYQIIKMSDDEGAIFFMEDELSYDSDYAEKEKFDTIQENYLFSMIVDLKNDTCKNSVTTEVRADKMGLLDIKYSEWRYMISNMFTVDDKSMFLNMSEPEYIIERLEKEKSFKFEIQMQNMQGEYIWSRLMFNRVKGFSRDNPVFVYTVQDINEDMLRLLQQENIIAAVEAKNEQLTNINAAKNVFISNMSHEIRTPINAVIGMDEMIMRETEDKRILEHAGNIKNAARMLLSIINDILDFSKIEAGKMEIIPVEYNVAAMIKEVCSMLSIKMKEKGLSFRIKIDQSMPSVLLGDDLRIKQIIINILTNAVKYTNEGSITFRVDCIQNDGKNADIRVEVEDTGIGMKSEEMSKLFVEFERLDEQRNHNVEGAGLGLSIVVKLLEQMGSELEVESEYGQGSTFGFTLRQTIINQETISEFAKRSKELSKEGQKCIRAPKAKVLVVDDNAVNLEVVIGLLERTQVQIDTASNGQECLEKIVTDHYDIVFLDHIMPVMDGVEAVDRIRNMDGIFKTIPVIALTANVMSDAYSRYKNAGFTDFMEKPVHVNTLEDMLNKYLPDNLKE